MFRSSKVYLWSSAILALSSLGLGWGGTLALISGSSTVYEYILFHFNSVEFVFVLYFDPFSLLFFSVVSLIAASVMFYSGSYMSMDKGQLRFSFLVDLFVGSMFILVFSLNLVSIMLGWDGLGLVSYVLVVYYQNEKSNAAGMITALSNRIGDAAIMISVGSAMELGGWDFMSYTSLWEGELRTVLYLVSLAAMTKSAQVPFSAWLPAAMAAPTPVSALVHSSTLVTAGVYLLVRFSPLFNGTLVLKYLTITGLMTVLLASVSALFEEDLKKVIALSTLSQLGIMVMTIGLGAVELAYLHMMVHAVFKALLFMCGGKIIHMMGDAQDMRSMGSFALSLPFTSMSLTMANLALSGFPFLAGFYSKDLLLETFLMEDNSCNMYVIYFLAIGLSASYSFRLSYYSLIIWGNSAAGSSSEEEDWTMINSKLFLMLGSIFSGAFFSWLLFSAMHTVSLTPCLKSTGLMSAASGLMLGLSIALSATKSIFIMNNVSKLAGLMSMWWLPSVSGEKAAKDGFFISSSLGQLDTGCWETAGGRGASTQIMFLSSVVVSTQWAVFKKFLLLFLIMFMFGVLVFYLEKFLSM